MIIDFHISRDLRDGKPLDIKRDGYRWEHPDIPVRANVIRYDDDFEISARISEDVPRMNEEGLPLEGLLFTKGQRIELTADEEDEAIEDYCRFESA